MKSINKIALSLCLLTVSLLPNSSFSHSAAAAPTDTPVFLKINDYYVLYTPPKAPYVDQNNRLLIPLRSISELLGATVAYDSITKMATIKMNNKTVTYQIDSMAVTVNHAPSTLDTKPVLYQNSMFIPLSSLVNNLGINNEWNQTDKLYTLTGENLMKTPMMLNWEDMDHAYLQDTDNVNAFRPVSYKYDLTNKTVIIKSKNISGADVRENVRPYFLFANSAQFDNIDRDHPVIKKDAVFENTSTIASGSVDGVPLTLAYILVKGRSLKSV